MLDRKLMRQYIAAFGHTFTVSYWDQRPGERVNELMRAAIAQGRPIVTDKLIADELATRIHGDEKGRR